MNTLKKFHILLFLLFLSYQFQVYSHPYYLQQTFPLLIPWFHQSWCYQIEPKFARKDDLLGATDTIHEAMELKTQIQQIFAMMKTQISKWNSISIASVRTTPNA